MDKSQYVSEGIRQLGSKHYVEICKPDLFTLNNAVQNKVTHMYEKGTLDKDTYKFLSTDTTSFQFGRLYLLPKIHKIEESILNSLSNGLCSLRQLPPGRPIISQCSTPTYNIGTYCDHFLIPIVRNQSTYIRDTTDFIAQVENISLPNDILLVTYDVTSMYTNMEFEELLNAVKKAYSESEKPASKIPYPDVSDLVFLIKTILENNVFEFNGKYYKQIIGCAMGSTVSPEVSDIRMYQITQSIMTKFQHASKVLFHGRYRDDGFMIFKGNKDEILEFFTIGNRCHKHLKFTFEISDKEANFLDTTVYKGKRFLENNTLDIKSFIKPTNSFQYLHRQSAHSPSVFKGFIQGECIRHLRNTNDETIYKNLTAGFKSHLLRRGYSHSEIDPIIQKTHLTQRNTVLQKTNKKTKNSVPLVMVTKYNPCVKNLKKRILKYWDKMTDDSACKEIFKEEPIISYSKHKNISDLIIRSRLPPSDNDT